MDLNDLELMKTLDTQDMYGQIAGLPGQLKIAWQLGKSKGFSLTAPVNQVIVSGMGGSAIGADLAAAYIEDKCPVPVTVNRGYGLPAWAKGENTLCIMSSHSGNTEETLSAYEQASQRGCQMLVFSTGGKLAQLSVTQATACWHFEHHGQPRAAVGLSFGMVLSALYQSGLIPDQTALIDATVTSLGQVSANWTRETPVHQNPAKRMAGQCVGRNTVVMAADFLAPVARRWKGQINELAKALAQFEYLPEADHNTLAGIEQPDALLEKQIIYFLRSDLNHPRNIQRIGHTQRLMMAAGINTDIYQTSGENKLEHLWQAVLFGDYTAYYLAMAYGCDPTPIPAISGLKQLLG